MTIDAHGRHVETGILLPVEVLRDLKALVELQAYVDERARGLSVPGRGSYSEIERRTRLKEAMEIGMYIARLIKRGQG